MMLSDDPPASPHRRSHASLISSSQISCVPHLMHCDGDNLPETGQRNESEASRRPLDSMGAFMVDASTALFIHYGNQTFFSLLAILSSADHHVISRSSQIIIRSSDHYISIVHEEVAFACMNRCLPFLLVLVR